MVNPSTAPALFSVQDAFKGPYAARIQEFTEAGQHAAFTPAHEDREKIAVVLVDYQHDFVDPSGTLNMPGSQHVIARFLPWFYTHGHKITSVYASLDTHLPFHIFFRYSWINPRTGERPQ